MKRIYNNRIPVRFLILVVMNFIVIISLHSIANAGKNTIVRFAVAADGHWYQPDVPYQKYYSQFIMAVNKLHKDRPLDFVVLIGDLVHDAPDQLPVVKKQLDQLFPRYFVVPGNHDLVDPEKWKKLWGYAINATIKIKNVALILANTSDKLGNYDCVDSTWLKQALNQFPSQNVFVFAHITQKKWTRFGINCPDILELLTKIKSVRAVFHGHDHDIDEVRELSGTPYIFVGRFGGSWGGRRQFKVVEFDPGKAITISRYDIETGMLEKQAVIEHEGVQ